MRPRCQEPSRPHDRERVLHDEYADPFLGDGVHDPNAGQLDAIVPERYEPVVMRPAGQPSLLDRPRGVTVEDMALNERLAQRRLGEHLGGKPLHDVWLIRQEYLRRVIAARVRRFSAAQKVDDCVAPRRIVARAARSSPNDAQHGLVMLAEPHLKRRPPQSAAGALSVHLTSKGERGRYDGRVVARKVARVVARGTFQHAERLLRGQTVYL